MSEPFSTATRALAHGLALNRVAFGARFMLQPSAAGPTWVGRRRARGTGTQLFVRALGARDLALGLGALRALRTEDDAAARAWFAAHALADGADLVATLAARRELPAFGVAFASVMAAGSTAIAVAAAFRL